MNVLKTAALGFAALALTSGAALAQAASGDHMGKMSAHDTKMMKSCQAMDHDAMMKNADCQKMMKAHPDMMKHDEMMKK